MRNRKNKWYTRQAIQKVEKGGYRGLLEVGNIIGDEAQKITPLDTGELETSLTVEGDKKTLTVGIGFTKRVDGVDVATLQHENPNYNHAPGKQWKYLQQPLFQIGPAILPSTVAEEIRKELK